MNEELSAEGHDVMFAAVNASHAENAQASLAGKCDYPLFQDTDEAGVWELHEGGKDDIYIYSAAGLLTHYMSNGGPVSITLSSTAGYANVKNAILDTLAE